jgi:hypothetical protein
MTVTPVALPKSKENLVDLGTFGSKQCPSTARSENDVLSSRTLEIIVERTDRAGTVRLAIYLHVIPRPNPENGRLSNQALRQKRLLCST